MLRYVIRRIAQMAGVVIVLSMLLFLWLRSLPGGPVSAILGERATPESRARLERVLGLATPAQEPLGRGRLEVGDVEDAAEAVVTAIAIILGIPLGYLAARHQGRWLDNVSIVSSLVGVAVPVFFLAFLLKYFFAIRWGVLPVSGRQDASLDCTRVTGFFVLDGLLTREFDCSANALKHLILPAVALSSIPFAVIFRITRASVLDVLDAAATSCATRCCRW